MNRPVGGQTNGKQGQRNMRYTDVAWDFDGTLADSYPNCIRAMREALKSFGHEESDENVRKELIVTTRHAMTFFAEKYGLDREELRRRYKAMEGFHPELVIPFPGIHEVLKAVKESGRRNHLYTNRDRDAVRYLEALGLREYFDGLMTDEEMAAYKPDPDGMIKLIGRYQIEPAKLLMVGDRALDLDASKSAGGDGCFYNTNGTPVPESADFVVYDIRELLKYL